MTPSSKVGDRDQVLYMASQAPENSIGKAIYFILVDVVGLNFMPFSIRNFGSAGLAQWVKAHKSLFEAEATDENIRKYANAETSFFATCNGTTKMLGKLLSSKERIALLKLARDKNREGVDKYLANKFGMNYEKKFDDSW